jgi:mannose-6-phosphate isomerase-like protein (cupin superfamily)
MKQGKKPFVVKKPWGKFIQFTLNEKTTVKILELRKGEETSLQRHESRNEFWYAIDDGIEVSVKGRKYRLKKGDSISIPKKSLHKLVGRKQGRILEISFGHFDENDIERISDKYGRIESKKRK